MRRWLLALSRIHGNPHSAGRKSEGRNPGGPYCACRCDGCAVGGGDPCCHQGGSHVGPQRSRVIRDRHVGDRLTFKACRWRGSCVASEHEAQCEVTAPRVLWPLPCPSSASRSPHGDAMRRSLGSSLRSDLSVKLSARPVTNLALPAGPTLAPGPEGDGGGACLAWSSHGREGSARKSPSWTGMHFATSARTSPQIQSFKGGGHTAF